MCNFLKSNELSKLHCCCCVDQAVSGGPVVPTSCFKSCPFVACTICLAMRAISGAGYERLLDFLRCN